MWSLLPFIVFDPIFQCWPRVQTVFFCLTILRVCGQRVVHWCLFRWSFWWPHYSMSTLDKFSWPLVGVLDLHSKSFHFPETALFYVSVRSYSTMFLHVFLLGNCPGSNSSSSIITPKIQFIPVPRLSFCAPRTGITISFFFFFFWVAAVRSNKMHCRTKYWNGCFPTCETWGL